MKRDITHKLLSWKNSSNRKPLILKGARQVGKTWSLKDFGKRYFQNTLYISLEKIAPNIPSEYARFFDSTNNPHRILQGLSLYTGKTINKEDTLIIFDEIQDCPAALHSLKYFAEDASEYYVASAGSLLGVALASKDSFPVGKVNFIQMSPLSFSEFLRAVGEKALDTFCATTTFNDPMLEAFVPRLEEQLRIYMTTGGMPEAVSCWAKNHEMKQVDNILSDLLDSYERDFAKHSSAHLFAKISQVWHSLPSQLAKENKKFLYGTIKKGARAREYEDALIWLKEAGLIHVLYRNRKPAIPLSAYNDLSSFKAYCLDVGVLRKLSGLSISIFFSSHAAINEFKGSFTENLILESLVSAGFTNLNYWANDKPKHEIDFLLQHENLIIPIEVKASTNINSLSLRYYGKAFPEQTPLRVRFSMRGLTLDGNILNIPLYLADHADRLITFGLGNVI